MFPFFSLNLHHSHHLNNPEKQICNKTNRRIFLNYPHIDSNFWKIKGEVSSFFTVLVSIFILASPSLLTYSPPHSSFFSPGNHPVSPLTCEPWESYRQSLHMLTAVRTLLEWERWLSSSCWLGVGGGLWAYTTAASITITISTPIPTSVFGTENN